MGFCYHAGWECFEWTRLAIFFALTVPVGLGMAHWTKTWMSLQRSDHDHVFPIHQANGVTAFYDLGSFRRGCGDDTWKKSEILGIADTHFGRRQFPAIPSWPLRIKCQIGCKRGYSIVYPLEDDSLIPTPSNTIQHHLTPYLHQADVRDWSIYQETVDHCEPRLWNDMLKDLRETSSRRWDHSWW